jgi:hypothetical protein
VIRDSAGFVAQRIVACIVNIGCDIAQQRVASAADIDRAVTLGLGYPKGPLAFGDALGARNVLHRAGNHAGHFSATRATDPAPGCGAAHCSVHFAADRGQPEPGLATSPRSLDAQEADRTLAVRRHEIR